MCEKEYYFKLKNNNVCVLYIPTMNSKLEKFVQKQHSLWQLTGSSLGALTELLAVAAAAAAWQQRSIGISGSAAAAVCHQHGGGGQ